MTDSLLNNPIAHIAFTPEFLTEAFREAVKKVHRKEKIPLSIVEASINLAQRESEKEGTLSISMYRDELMDALKTLNRDSYDNKYNIIEFIGIANKLEHKACKIVIQQLQAALK